MADEQRARLLGPVLAARRRQLHRQLRSEDAPRHVHAAQDEDVPQQPLAGQPIQGLLLTHASRSSLSYDDCERFSGCPDRVTLTANAPCVRPYSSAWKLRVRRGWLVAEYGGDNSPLVFAGRMATLAAPGVVGDLKVLRRERPRIPRAFLAALTGTQRAQLKPYRAC